MKLITSAEYVDALNLEITTLRKQLKQHGIKPIEPPDYVSISKQERLEGNNLPINGTAENKQ